MFPHRFNPSHSRPHSDRSPRPWNSHGDSRERRDPHRERERPVHHNHSAEGERPSRRRDYSTSPKRPYRKEPFDADRSRRSPLRRRMSSPGWDSSEKKRQSFEGERSHYSYDGDNNGEDFDYRFRHVSAGKTRQWSSDRSDVCGTKDLEPVEFQGSDFRHTRRSPDYRHRHHREDVTYGHHDDCDSRPSSGSHKDRDGHRSGYCLPERKPSEGQSSKYYESDVAQNQAAVPQQSTSAKGFQRFLDLLNKGVDVDMLNKIVGQMPSDHRAHSSNSTANVDGQRDVTQQHRNNHQSQSPEKSTHPAHSRSHSRSPQRADKVALTPEDEHKHKQMQDVLQAIGMNLGFEELGQMSHRIQERLYGKRESEGGEGKSKEKGSRRGRVPLPRSQSRSSSSSSSQSPSPPERHAERFSLSVQEAELGGQRLGGQRLEGQHLGDQHPMDQRLEGQCPGDQHLGGQCPGDHHLGGQRPGDQLPGDQPTYSYERHFTPAVLPTHPPANYPLLPYPPPPPSPALPRMPPGPALFLPPRPPILHPPPPPFNTFPPQMARASYCPPQYAVGPQPWLNPLAQPANNNPQKAKAPSRPRCLQVIETKQAG